MREEKKIKVFSNMEELYSKRRHLKEVKKFEKCNRSSKRI